MKVYCHATAGTVDVRFNGCPVYSRSSMNTLPSGGIATRAVLGDGYPPYSMSYVRIDDFYVCDGTGSKNNDFLGDVLVKLSKLQRNRQRQLLYSLRAIGSPENAAIH
jgi:hypothetical protein